MSTPPLRCAFILGTGRTGTLFLRQFLARNLPGSLVVHEPSRWLKLCSNRHLAGRMEREGLRKELARFARSTLRHARREQKTGYIQVDPWLFAFTGLLDEAFAEPAVVHIVRDPLTYIPSHLNRMYKTPLSGVLRDLIPYWKARGDLAGDFSRRAWAALSHEEQLAWYWRKCNTFIEEQAASLKRFKRFRYEDLFADNTTALGDLLEFIGIETREPPYDFEGLDRNTAPPRYAACADWPPDRFQRVAELCGPAVQRYGYAIDPAPPGDTRA